MDTISELRRAKDALDYVLQEFIHNENCNIPNWAISSLEDVSDILGNLTEDIELQQSR